MSQVNIIIRTGYQYVSYLYYIKNLNWAAQKIQMGSMWPVRRLDIAELESLVYKPFNVL